VVPHQELSNVNKTGPAASTPAQWFGELLSISITAFAFF
jgi:hypothetical protein